MPSWKFLSKDVILDANKLDLSVAHKELIASQQVPREEKQDFLTEQRAHIFDMVRSCNETELKKLQDKVQQQAELVEEQGSFFWRLDLAIKIKAVIFDVANEHYDNVEELASTPADTLIEYAPLLLEMDAATASNLVKNIDHDEQVLNFAFAMQHALPMHGIQADTPKPPLLIELARATQSIHANNAAQGHFGFLATQRRPATTNLTNHLHRSATEERRDEAPREDEQPSNTL